ncbi:uncharacterized protein LOC128071776 isoform X2 [Tympanuchus pallidicinctus]|uniref:uncharacterized protein LOC128071776 isoform X2 n=1 Tax=Tympanuchus pallidicinctus TaxID=109042 RepID=UPI0022875C5F|nr:uncharacterized protein LOC128071776 isoform X2 [Tympanuchus pallidicinctus]
MLACLGLIFMTQWMLLVAQMYDDWQCTNWEMSDSPIQNLMLNWWKTELSWISTMNFTKYNCSMSVYNNVVEIQEKNTNCIFGRNLAYPLHNGANFSVKAESTNSTYSVTCKYIPQGINGSAIKNFSCVIYDISLMNCTWQAGRNAPGDTQYFLYWQNSRDDDVMECELYIEDENGRHVGCRFKNVKIEKSYFLVNGSSKNSLIQFYDTNIDLYTIEKLMPPSNVTVSCDENSHSCTIRWQQPQINHSKKDRCFKYEVEITSKGNSAEWTNQSYTKEIITSHIVQNPNMRKKNLVKIRAAGHTCRVSKDWGEWSAAVEFGNEEISSSVWILPVVAVATLSIAIFTIFFCKRTGYWKAVFPQVPKPKNPFHGQLDINPQASLYLYREEKMFRALGLTCMICWCMMLFCPLHADLQCMGSGTQELPISNLTLNQRRMELSWQSSKNFSSYKCTMAANFKLREMKVKNKSCRFEVEDSVPLYRGAAFTITVPKTNISKICPFFPEGINGSAIENFSCVIYDISLMNCTWQAGRNAPGDTQYFLYWQNSRDDDQTECELYIKDENDRNVGCKFQNVTIKDKTTYFLVNGSHKAFLIQFYDNYTKLYTIERLPPPLNVTANCTSNPGGCIITWQQPLLSHVENTDCFEYEINIQTKYKIPEEKKDPPVIVTENKYEFKSYNAEKKSILKIRARGKRRCSVNRKWGEWSNPVEFGEEKDYFIYVILVLIALGTILLTLLHYCLCKRYCSSKRIFPPIPQPRGKFDIPAEEDIQKQCLATKLLQKHVL